MPPALMGNAAYFLVMPQVMTGILLALVYKPSAGSAWGSLQVLDHNVPLGCRLRAIHGWGSNLIAIELVHMMQVFSSARTSSHVSLPGSSAFGLLLLTLAMVFTGQVMRFDQDAYWGVASAP